MKRTVKRILPILLAIVTICSIAWYLFIYDQSFTRDMLLSGARYFDSKGSYAISAWLYDQAYRQSQDNEVVALELADRFKALGNYTKAETTLTGAIADGGSAELYIALSKTYVEQDKLLDAVAMLDNITDEAIKAQLDAQRPATPTVDLAPGFYNQHLPVTFTTTGGTLYLTTDGEYPSIADKPSTGALTLASGENTIYALCVGDNGLVSSLAIFGYTVSGVVEPVTLADPTVDVVIRQQLQVGSDAILYSNQLWEITSLTLPEGAASYEDLARLPYLQELTISGGTASSLSGVETLTQLTSLTVTGCSVTAEDLSGIAALPKLENLTLSGCNLSNIAPLSSARALTHLNLSANAIRDASALSFLQQLVSLDLSHNALESLNALSALSSLQQLDVSYNSLSSIVPISSCTALTVLNIHNNNIASLAGAEKLAALSDLDASYNVLTDVQNLSSCTELTQLDISNNALSDISPLAPLVKLQTLNFSRNEVTTLPSWGTSCALVIIDGSYNKIKNISGLAGYENLNTVLMDYNNISKVNALSACHNLIKVSVYGNPVKDVSELTAMSIIVNYNPLN